ncbi:hypothetical protein [Leisingera aquimarina]|uniref:hypothetical protein n=1 Tax=Leisingera aquimarina TaxID=476529 RepID=UPI0004837E28|nr:hypothetical protein [Leisingera aquimarina]
MWTCGWCVIAEPAVSKTRLRHVVADLQPDGLARAHAAAIGERQHYARLQAGRHGEDAPDLVAAQHKRHFHRFLQAENLGCQILPPQGDPEQKLHPGHGLVAGANAGPGLDQMQL